MRTNEFRIIEEMYLSLHVILVIILLNEAFPLYASAGSTFVKVFAILFAIYVAFKVIYHFMNNTYDGDLDNRSNNTLMTIIDGLFFLMFIVINIRGSYYFIHFYFLFQVLQSIRFATGGSLFFTIYTTLLYLSTEIFYDINNINYGNVFSTIVILFVTNYIIKFSLGDIKNLGLERHELYNELKDKNEELSRLANTDYLTSLANHQSFYSLYEGMKNAKPMSLALFDIDNFKNINDTYGHLVGDVILKELSSILKRHVRSSDFPARYGGEEFAVIFPNTNLKDAIKVCERIRESVENHVFDSGENKIKITISVGVDSMETLDCREENDLEFINDVDSLLYRAKKEGKNKVVSPCI
ncbi:MAG: GGDEF domain-containing protein [Firmicutes bacterium]|jgi:diguanylate cyclase (GGDEF)-like protein|nr:GGDEF domain-containing protein [Bacillota bacterium]